MAEDGTNGNYLRTRTDRVYNCDVNTPHNLSIEGGFTYARPRDCVSA